MSETDRKTVLISEPQLMEMGLPYLPIMWGILKTYWEKQETGKECLDWLPPISQPAEVSTLLRPYQDTPIDVLGLSCYTWNWTLQCQIAQAVKALHPQCVVVAGGPDPDYKDPDFFKKYPFIDMVAVRDGEVTFTQILNRVLEHGDTRELLADRKSFLDIPGLYLPGSEAGGHIFTGPTLVPTEFLHSPYIEQTAHYEKIRATFGADVIAVWETNRGCPFSCSFCDWGSNTMSRLRRFDMERIRAEVEWFAHMKVTFIMLADANFGILERDLEIADILNEVNQKRSYPKYFSYNTAKNSPERTVAIAKKFLKSGLMSMHVLSIQHTNRDVLAATDRANISTKKQFEVTRELMADGVPVFVQLILGIPGDRLELWQACFSDLMEWGIHGSYFVFPYSLLPNAPAAEPEYMQKWEIETIDRYVLLNHGERKPGPFDPIKETKSRLIVKTKTYSRADWVEMNAYTAYIKAVHNGSMTQLIALYLRFTHDVTYNEFYTDLFANFFTKASPSQAWHQAVKAHYQYYLETDDAVTFMDLPQFPEFEYQVDPHHWILIQICFYIEEFFGAMETYLLERYPAITNLKSIIEYQKNLIILPSYNRKAGKLFAIDLDWITYFEQVRRTISYSPLAEPEPIPGTIVRVSDDSYSDEGVPLPLDWGRGDEEAKWHQWIHTMGVGNNSYAKNNFHKLQLERFAFTF